MKDIKHSLVDGLVEHWPIAIVRTIHTIAAMMFSIERDEEVTEWDERDGGDIECHQ
jgi:hypothetical protein